MSLLLRIKDLAQAIGADIKALRVGKVDVVSGKGLSTNDYTTVEKSKLTGVAVGATKNATDAQLRDRGSHTGTQAATTITGLSDAATHPYGTTINTVMQGNDIRVVNGATAFGWGNHATAGYIKSYVDTTYTAGAGVTLTGGAFSVKYGSAANTSAQGNDSRLSNSREWTGATISQSEAEAGSATTRRAFTAQRVRQAIVAWFNGISGTIGRTILGRSTSAQVRGDLGLGTAATRDVGESSGNVMEVGAFGIGRESLNLSTPLTHIDGIPLGAFVRYNAIDSVCVDMGLPSLGAASDIRWWNVQSSGFWTRRTLIATEVFGIGTTRGRTFVCVKHDATWYPWQELITTGNILSTTGQSTKHPMSQKAVTDAINAMRDDILANAVFGFGTLDCTGGVCVGVDGGKFASI